MTTDPLHYIHATILVAMVVIVSHWFPKLSIKALLIIFAIGVAGIYLLLAEG